LLFLDSWFPDLNDDWFGRAFTHFDKERVGKRCAGLSDFGAGLGADAPGFEGFFVYRAE
jgi:hypothetical protein